jgi:hypothetical protein
VVDGENIRKIGADAENLNPKSWDGDKNFQPWATRETYSQI